jgi:hypothetical protein
MKQGLEAATASSDDSGNDDANGRNGRLKLAGSRRAAASEVRYCEECNGVLAGARAGNRRTKYCFSCSEAVGQQQSAEWKRQKRKALGWRRYKEEYNTFSTPEEERAYHRAYQRKWRARNKPTP